jgi:trigger factor
MQVTVENQSSVKKTLHIEIPQDRISSEIDAAYSQLKKTAKIKGFRPGKAPRSVLVRLFRKDVHSDVTSKLIQESFLDALKQTELKVVGGPKVDAPELKENEPYRYDAVVEVKPDLADVEFKGLKLKRELHKISEEEVALQLKALQRNLAKLRPVEGERPAARGDHAVITYEGLKGGKPYTETQRTENFVIKIGEDKIHPDFDAGVVGMKVGQNREIKVTFPEDHFNKKLAGLTIDFQVTLTELREEELPEINDELAKKAGDYGSLDALKTRIRQNLEQGYAKRAEQELNEQVFKTLIEKADFEVPEVMVAHELETIIADTERSFAYRNTSLEEMGLSRDIIAEKYRDTAVKQVKRHLILDKIIEQEKLNLADEELEAGLKDMADSFGQPVEQIKSFYSQNEDKLDYFKQTLLEKKAITLIMNHSEIEEIETGDTQAAEGAGESAEK